MLISDADSFLTPYRDALRANRGRLDEIAAAAGVSTSHLNKLIAGRVNGQPANPGVRTLAAIGRALIHIGADEAPEVRA